MAQVNFYLKSSILCVEKIGFACTKVVKVESVKPKNLFKDVFFRNLRFPIKLYSEIYFSNKFYIGESLQKKGKVILFKRGLQLHLDKIVGFR